MFLKKLDALVEKNNSLLCVGLDTDTQKLSQSQNNISEPQYAYNKTLIDETYDLVCAYKLNSAFYEASGDQGIKELKKTCDYLKQTYPQIPIILDAKRADIDSTNQGYVKFAFEYLGTDAITLSPYLGRESLQPFLNIVDKGCIILCKTSNPGSNEFQNHLMLASQEPLYQYVAKQVTEMWNANNNCLLVVGATYPNELKSVREIAPEMTFLIPGVGAQGADIEATVQAGLRPDKKGLIISSSRNIIFAKDPREQVSKLRTEINQYR